MLVADEISVYTAILTAQEQGVSVALATIITVVGSVPRHVGSKMLIRPDGTIIGTVGGGAMESLVVRDAQAALSDGAARTTSYTLNDIRNGDPGICGGTVEVFIEPLFSRPTLLVIGCGHVGKALAELGKWTGYRVLVSDDRAEFCNPTHIPNMDGYLLCAPSAVREQVTIDRQTYVAAVTRGLRTSLSAYSCADRVGVASRNAAGDRDQHHGRNRDGAARRERRAYALDGHAGLSFSGYSGLVWNLAVVVRFIQQRVNDGGLFGSCVIQ